jgi:hypothetical protein
MVTVTVKYRGSEKKFCFTKSVITFGPKSSSEVDIPLPLDDLEVPHAKIVELNGRYTVHNLANDPEVRYNDLPFGRRTLTSGAVLNFHGVEAVVHKVENFAEAAAAPREPPDSIDDDLSLLMKEVDSLSVSCEDPDESREREKSGKGLLRAGVSAAIILLVLGTAALTLCFSSYAKTGDEELKAARGLSDAAMALFYAKIHNIKPPNRNWSDPNFLKQILEGIVPKSTNEYCSIDSQGNFTDFPYILRIYTNDDASRFLLLAQPKPSFIRWFRPKNSIVVDSSQMELRKLKDIQPLNRIIFNTTDLNASTIKRIALLVNEGRLIPIEKLGKGNSEAQFSPPDELKTVAPGAQNVVYNAPRYHKITEPLLNEALEGRITGDYLKDLSNMMETPNLVLYTTEGVKTAVEAYNNLSGYVHPEKLLIGYFTYNNQTHLPVKTELLAAGSQSEKEKQIALSSGRPAAKPNSELSQKMVQLKEERKQALTPLGIEVINLIRDNNEKPNKKFNELLTSRLKQYQAADIDQQKKISQSLVRLYKDYVVRRKKLTKKQFIANLKSSGLIADIKNLKPPRPPLSEATGRVRAPLPASALR